MSQIFLKKRWFVGVALLLVSAAVLLIVGMSKHDSVPLVTATVETGPVRQLVSVSGVVEAADIADLAFPVSGIAATVPVREGDTVTAGTVLVTLTSDALQADRQDALAALASARAAREELINGLRNEDRTVVDETVASKRTALEQTRSTQQRTVENARRALLSNDLAVVSADPEETATPPSVTGTYRCEATGEYRLSLYNSRAASGYSYQVSGLEDGTYEASTEQPIAFGTCGLRLEFDPDSRYGNTEWTIRIPNTDSPTYTTKRNAYELAQVSAERAITLAEQELALAEASALSDTAPARSEAVAKANASVAQAAARVDRIDAEIKDRTVRAPFDGVITSLDILPGETVSTQPIVTLLADGRYELTARVPEIDIGKLSTGQSAQVVFDTRDDVTLDATIVYLSPQATEIDGVAYYEAKLDLPVQPDWLRSGLNADVDIIVAEETTALRLPTRFLTRTDSGYAVRLARGTQVATTTVELVLRGNDGFVAVTGLSAGDQVVAP